MISVVLSLCWVHNARYHNSLISNDKIHCCCLYFELSSTHLQVHDCNMARQKASLGSKQPAVPDTSQRRKKKQQSLEDNLATFEELHHIKEAGKQQHLQAETTQKAYGGHVCQGREWLQDLLSRNDATNLSEEDLVLFNDPAFKNVFDDIPNHLSARVLAWYLSWSGFCKNLGQSTIEGIHAAFKKLWEQASVSIT